VFVVLAAIAIVRADSVSDMLRGLNFTMLLAYGAIAWFFIRRGGVFRAEWIPLLAGIGVVIGFGETLIMAMAGVDRAKAINIGPIVLSNAMLALGFISLGGAMLRKDRWGWLYVVPPVLAIGVTILTSSRGPLICVPFAILAAAFWFWRTRFGGDRRVALLILGGLVALGAVLAFVLLNTRAASLIAIVDALTRGEAVLDSSTRERLVLWQAGWQSFLASPWLGHGWGNIMDSIRPFMSVEDAGLVTLPQLHNDVLNFAVGAGVVGVGCYLAIISTPLIGAWLSPRDSLRSFRLYGATMLTIVYVGGGLTDLMFGFEFHTFLFVMLTAILLGLCRDRQTA
jgi:O-antigen ligase